MKTFLVTGCMGYIGSHMCVELRHAYPGCTILGVDIVNKPHLLHLVDHFSEGNISDTRNVMFPLFYHSIDAIFHFAAAANVPQGEQHPTAYYVNNLESTLGLIRMAKHTGVTKFIFSSSCAVYGDPIGNSRLIEDHPLNPKSVYARTKMLCENILDVPNKEGLMEVAILRYFNAAGRNVEADLHEEHVPETHLIPLLANSNSIEIFGTDYNTPDGTCIRDYMHVVDICRAHIKAYEHLESVGSITCNLGTGWGYSVKEIVELAQKEWDKEITITYSGRRQGDASMLVADTFRMKNMLQFTPEHDILSILKSMRNGSNDKIPG